MSNAKDWREVKARAALRNRIAAAIKRVDESYLNRPEPFMSEPASYEELADAVIEELNLHTDKVGTWIRHVTDWKSEDES